MVAAAAADDAPGIAPLLAELGYPADAATVAARLRRPAAAGDVVLVARIRQAIAGVASVHLMPVLHEDEPVGYVTALVVAPAFQRQGVGRALIAAVEQHARAQGCTRLSLTSNVRRLDAHSFYEALGFARTGLRFTKKL
jgi:GNAT superfamily N-acetyltransferase